MAQNITLLGASYSDVPAVTLPKTGGGTARFDDCTVVTAEASDVRTGETFVASDGTVTSGSMPSGTAGTPTATKGAVSNHSIAVTPSVTNTTGYITGSTKTGTAVTVSASELDSGTKSITSNGSSQDVVGYASVDVNVPNSYSASDEGKVVSSGALVAQTAHADVTPTTSDQTIDTTTNNSIKVKGDADLVAGNIKKDVEIFGVTGSYEGGGGGGISVDDIATNSAPSGAVTLGSGVTSIGSWAFGLKPLTSISGANVTTVGESAFQQCTNLTSVSFPNATSLGNGSFRQCKLTSASFPAATTVGTSVFQSNVNTLLSVSLPEATTIGNNFVFDCEKLTDVSIPKCTKINGNSFQQCYALEVIDLPKVTQIEGNAFYNCRKLGTMILRHTSVVTLSNVSALANTPFRGYNSLTGTVYVPNALISTYKTATNWKTMYDAGTCNFVAIEGSQYE